MALIRTFGRAVSARVTSGHGLGIRAAGNPRHGAYRAGAWLEEVRGIRSGRNETVVVTGSGIENSGVQVWGSVASQWVSAYQVGASQRPVDPPDDGAGYRSGRRALRRVPRNRAALQARQTQRDEASGISRAVDIGNRRVHGIGSRWEAVA